MLLCTLALGQALLLGEGGGNTDRAGSSRRRHVAGKVTAMQLVDRDVCLVGCVNVGDSKRKKMACSNWRGGLWSASLKVSTSTSARGRKYKQ